MQFDAQAKFKFLDFDPFAKVFFTKEQTVLLYDEFAKFVPPREKFQQMTS